MALCKTNSIYLIFILIKLPNYRLSVKVGGGRPPYFHPTPTYNWPIYISGTSTKQHKTKRKRKNLPRWRLARVRRFEMRWHSDDRKERTFVCLGIGFFTHVSSTWIKRERERERERKRKRGRIWWKREEGGIKLFVKETFKSRLRITCV